MKKIFLLKTIIILFVGAITVMAQANIESNSVPVMSPLSVINNKTNVDITFTLPKAAAVKLLVYDMEGNCLSIVKEGELNAGVQRFTWDSRNHSTGVYFAYLKANDYITTQKFLIIR